MAVTFRASTDDARGTATNAQPALPAGTVDGDLLIAIQASDLNGSLAAMTAPVGWTEAGNGSRTDVGFMKVWTKTASAEPATHTFVDSTAAHGSAILITVTGQDPNTPLVVTPTFANGAASTTQDAPSVAGVANGMLITAALAGTAGTTRDYTPPPTGMTTAQKSTLTIAGNILTGSWYLALTTTAATGAKTATCTAATPWVTMSLVVGPPVPATVSPTGIATGETFGTATVTVGAAPAQTVFPDGIASAEAFGTDAVTVATAAAGGGLYPSETLFPSETLYPSDGGVPTGQIITAIGFDSVTTYGVPVVSVGVPPDQTLVPDGIGTGEALGSPVLTLANGPQTVVATPIDPTEAFGVPSVVADLPAFTVFAVAVDTAEAFGRPTVTREFAIPVVTGPTYVDTYYVDGIDLSNFVTQIEVAEGLQDAAGTVGDNVALPGLDGELAVYGAPGQPRRPDGPGKITFNMWLVGVDPNTGNVTIGNSAGQDYLARWDELVRRFRRRRLVVDHPRPDGTRRAVAHYAVGESTEPTDRRAGSPWFGRFKAVLTVPAAHWLDVTDVTTGTQSLATNGTLNLGVFAAATAPCTELMITFGAGNNPRLSTSYGLLGYNGTIAPGRQLVIDTATGSLSPGSGSAWQPDYANLVFSPGPRLFEIDPAEPLSAILTHTGGGTLSVEVSGKRRYRTS